MTNSGGIEIAKTVSQMSQEELKEAASWVQLALSSANVTPTEITAYLMITLSEGCQTLDQLQAVMGELTMNVSKQWSIRRLLQGGNP